VAEEDQSELFDGDSAYGAFSDMTDTVSLNSSLVKFRHENGRTYHSFGKALHATSVCILLKYAGSTEHWGPCDEDALDQQDIR
jgi:hypothetical protein